MSHRQRIDGLAGQTAALLEPVVGEIPVRLEFWDGSVVGLRHRLAGPDAPRRGVIGTTPAGNGGSPATWHSRSAHAARCGVRPDPSGCSSGVHEARISTSARAGWSLS